MSKFWDACDLGKNKPKRFRKAPCVDLEIEINLLSVSNLLQRPGFYELINCYWMTWFKKNFETLRYFKKQVDMEMWITATASSAYQISWRVFLKSFTQYK